MTVYPGDRGPRQLYEDDGESLDYRQGAFSRRRFAQRREASRHVVEVGAAEGSWRPATRNLVLRVRVDGEPARVVLDGKPIARLATPAGAPSGSASASAASGQAPASTYMLSDDGFVEVVLPDRGAAVSLALELTR